MNLPFPAILSAALLLVLGACNDTKSAPVLTAAPAPANPGGGGNSGGGGGSGSSGGGMGGGY